MTNYIFFIGGSGARTYKAFLHLCACGVINRRHAANSVDAVNVLLLDEDSENAACTECGSLYDTYRKNRGLFQKDAAAGKSDAFWCNVNMYQKNALSPVGGRQPKLANVPQGNGTGERALEWFYEQKERTQDLRRGFYAHPNIGCIFFQNFDLKNIALQNCLNSIVGELREKREIRVVIVGSVFGGTGAAGIPSVLNLIRDYCQERLGISPQNLPVHFGAVLIMPYFLVKPDRAEGTNRNLTINSSTFQSSTKAALRYYEVLDSFERLYLVGQKKLELVNPLYVDGGAMQDNKPHIVELFAAIGIKHFLENTQGQHRVMMRLLSGEPGEKIGWNHAGTDPDLSAMADMIRAQAVLETTVSPYYTDPQKISSARKLQWFKVFKMDSKLSRDELNIILEYGDRLLEWMYFLQYRYDGTGYDAQGNLLLVRDERIDLCGDVIRDVKKQIDGRGKTNAPPPERDSSERLKKILDNMHGIIEGMQGVEYLMQKIPLLMSFAGVSYGLTALGAVGLAINLIRLTTEKTRKRDKGGND